MDFNLREWTSITTLELNTELKNLVISCLDEPEFSTRFPTKNDYAYYWSKLIKYMNINYNLSPSKPDKFIFLLLLTYPRGYINRLQSFLDLKIAFNEIVIDGNIIGSSENSDFTCIGYYCANSNCICSQPIGNIYEFQNNLSGIVFNVGSVCNNRHRVVSEEDDGYKLMQRAERDRRNDVKNGWAQGTTEQNRILRKQKQSQNQKQKHTSKKQYSSDEDSYITNSICYVCNNQRVFSQSSKGVTGICSCIPAKIKTKNKLIFKKLLENIEIIQCINCNSETRKINNDNLCLNCKFTHKVSECLKCLKKFTQINSGKDKVCGFCKPKVKQCIDCFNLISSLETYKIRCYDCFQIKKQNEKYIDKKCETCNETFTILDEHNERTKCILCYKNTLRNCEACNFQVKILTVKKDGPNKGKKFYKCDNCYLFKWQVISSDPS